VLNVSVFSCLGGLYNLNIRELQTTETDLEMYPGVSKELFEIFIEFTYDKAIAREAHTGSRRMCPNGYKTPAAIGTVAMLYTNAHS
jgi:hypothetical protein